MRRLQSRILVLVLGFSAPALADEESTPVEASAEPNAVTTEPAAGPVQPFIPPGVDYPGIVDLGPRMSLYIDHTYEYANDLSTFWWVQGRGNKYRVALGGLYAFGSLRVHAEVPLQYTQLAIDSLMGNAPTDADRIKAALSLGDVITDAAYYSDLPSDAMPTHVGLGLRVRWPTHTTRYQFGLVNGGTIEFGFPYYLHLSPAAILSTSYGPVFLVVNQGVLAMLAKDIDLGGVLAKIPNMYFWESHVTAGLAATNWLAFTLEVLSAVQLNHVEMTNAMAPPGPDQTRVFTTRAVFFNPGATLDLGRYRLALAARLGLPGNSTRDFGVFTFSGTHAFLARLSYLF
jgi:hypothetical protein